MLMLAYNSCEKPILLSTFLFVLTNTDGGSLQREKQEEVITEGDDSESQL